MFRFLTTLMLVLLAPCLFAQGGSKTVDGYLVDSNDTRFARVLTSATTSEEVLNAIQFHFQRWDGKDANGNFIGYERLRKVRFEVALNMGVREWGENTTGVASGRWQVNSGLALYWTPQPSYQEDPSTEPLAFGGGRPIVWTDAAESTPAFDGQTNGAGPSGHYIYLQGQPTFWEDTWVSNALMRELRAWSGPTGSLGTRYLNVRSVVERFFPSHWAEWGDTSFSFRNLDGTSVKLRVTYFYDTAPTDRVIVQQSPWQPMGLRVVDASAGAQSLTLPGYTGDPTKLRDFLFETNMDFWDHFALENMGGVSAICGGGGIGGLALTGPYGEYLAAMGYNTSVGSSNSPVSAFDGVCDFEGTSGITRYSRSNWPAYDSWCLSDHPGMPASTYSVPQIPVQVATPWDSVAFISLTSGVPDSAFQWWYWSTIEARTRTISFRVP